ncbi:MAG TPA: glucoamylase [Alphaproteobacteria bacterium]|nr:glucoamylase [Alphaproteobacteria bacterium]
MSSLELGVVGNCTYGGLIDEDGRVVWACLPRFDSDPVFCALLNGGKDSDIGFYDVELIGKVRSEQEYKENTAVLVTRLYDNHDNAIEISDFAPRFTLSGRSFRPTTLIRRIRPLSGTPRIRIRLRPVFDYGATLPTITHGSNHIRYVSSNYTIRVTTNAPVSYVLNETPFVLTTPTSLFLGPDETLQGAVEETAREFQERTENYWRQWVRRLALPLEWQEAVIRAAITLKLCTFEETGAIVAAMTTSIPEAFGTERNWDYRYCWLRDAFFVVRALNSLAEVETMEDYLRYLTNIVSMAENGQLHGHLQPVYGIGLEAELVERIETRLTGYRGHGPVRVGNQAYEHFQYDVYGNAVLAAAQAFFDKRLLAPPGLTDFERLERVGEQAFRLYDQPDAGMWELRTHARVHTSSSLMCWAACDRLAKIAAHLSLPARALYWQERADTIKQTILTRAWSENEQSFVHAFDEDGFDASLLLMGEVNFIAADDPRFIATLNAVEGALKRGPHMFRYVTNDDFGTPQNAFNICTFWYIDALSRVGRTDEAREIFENMLACRTRLGLLSEDTDPASNELWGNFPQTYSLVGIINAATRLSKTWQQTV